MKGFREREDAQSKAYQRFRHRPHANPLSDMEIPLPCTDCNSFPFEDFYRMENKRREFTCVDIGCGYGDFVKNMAVSNPNDLFIGLEIRDKPVAIAQQQLLDIRAQKDLAWNAAVIRCNCMRQLPFLLGKQSVKLLTIMFPDPQFKLAKESRRIVSTELVSEYAYYLRPNGYLCTCTDVEDLSKFMTNCIAANGNFEQVPLEQIDDSLVLCALGHMDRTADAERHQRKDEDKRVFKNVWKKIW